MNQIIKTKKALQIAKRSHEGQLRAIGSDLGLPYFDTHVMRVVRGVADRFKAVAALHDVIEDTEMSYDDAKEVIDILSENEYVALLRLSRLPSMTYFEYIERMVTEEDEEAKEIALTIKLADLMDNLSTVPDGSLRKRYIKAIAIISTELDISEG